jgi:hypothetical protein
MRGFITSSLRPVFWDRQIKEAGRKKQSKDLKLRKFLGDLSINGRIILK